MQTLQHLIQAMLVRQFISVHNLTQRLTDTKRTKQMI